MVSSPGTTAITYDHESRITSIAGPGTSASYTYNGLDTRVSKIENSTSRSFLRDGAYVTDSVLKEFDGSSLVADHTPGISERRGSTSTFHHGGIKSLDAQTSSVGSLGATRQYDAFGQVVNATGTWSGPFGHAGGFGYQEDATGLQLLGHRYYDPSTGRFLTRDPIKDGRNWYAYGAGDAAPVEIADPSGLIVGTVVRIGGAVVRIGGVLHRLGGAIGGALKGASKSPITLNQKEKDQIIDEMDRQGVPREYYEDISERIHDEKRSNAGPGGPNGKKGNDLTREEIAQIVRDVAIYIRARAEAGRTMIRGGRNRPSRGKGDRS